MSVEVHFNGNYSYQISLCYNTLDRLPTELEVRSCPSTLSEFSCFQPKHMIAINADQQARSLTYITNSTADIERAVSQWR